MSAQLEVRGVQTSFADQAVLSDVNFELSSGEIGCLLGPSGCGKTTMLRAIAGFQPVRAGEILLHGRKVCSRRFSIPPESRRVGMVFQDFALYPHLTVEKNAAFGLRKLSRGERQSRVDELLGLVGLTPERHRFPHEISGGQQQRVALIRAMAPRPDILLLDEPFSSMDVELRKGLASEVRNVLKRDGVTAILVTHDQLEAFAMADRIGVLGEGRLHQWASGYDLYHRPANRFVASFIGHGAMLRGQVIDTHHVHSSLGTLQGLVTHDLPTGCEVELLIRPDDVIHDESSPMRLEIVARSFRGAEYLYTLGLPSGERIFCMVPSHHDHAIGEPIGVRIEAEHLVAFKRGDY